MEEKICGDLETTPGRAIVAELLLTFFLASMLQPTTVRRNLTFFLASMLLLSARNSWDMLSHLSESLAQQGMIDPFRHVDTLL